MMFNLLTKGGYSAENVEEIVKKMSEQQQMSFDHMKAASMQRK